MWDAIDQQYLSPFAYYGIHDGLDLSDVPWTRGRGYDVGGLTNKFTANDFWAKQVIARLDERVEARGAMRALGFCVSIDHARFMARVFNEAGIPSVAVWANTPDDERRAALTDLAACKVNVVFSVDLFNEGVDVPVVDTLLLLRPTDSPTLFLQQLGRGLRRAAGKTVSTNGPPSTARSGVPCRCRRVPSGEEHPTGATVAARKRPNPRPFPPCVRSASLSRGTTRHALIAQGLPRVRAAAGPWSCAFSTRPSAEFPHSAKS